MKIFNKAQVDALFQREAVLVGANDVVPDFRAAELFGAKAVQHAMSYHDTRYSNSYGVGDYDVMYLTLRGFQVAASFYNVQQIRKEEQP